MTRMRSNSRLTGRNSWSSQQAKDRRMYSRSVLLHRKRVRSDEEVADTEVLGTEEGAPSTELEWESFEFSKT